MIVRIKRVSGKLKQLLLKFAKPLKKRSRTIQSLTSIKLRSFSHGFINVKTLNNVIVKIQFQFCHSVSFVVLTVIITLLVELMVV
jgi:hypothetical protein